MQVTDWGRLFSQGFPKVGATETDLVALVASVWNPLSPEEVRALNSKQGNPFPPSNPLHAAYRPFDAREWTLPSRSLPASYLDFLRFSNGGSFFNGERRFDPIFPAKLVREYLLCYHVPQYMPEAVPFAFDGCGGFWMFDMRQDPVQGEYPILLAHSGNLSYDDAVLVATALNHACEGTTDPNDLAPG